MLHIFESTRVESSDLRHIFYFTREESRHFAFFREKVYTVKPWQIWCIVWISSGTVAITVLKSSLMMGHTEYTAEGGVAACLDEHSSGITICRKE